MTDAPADIPAAHEGPKLAKVTFDQPITRGSQTIDAIQLRKPMGGELRGLSLSSLLQLEVDELRKLIPRISIPTLTVADWDNMDPADQLAVGAEVVDFLLPKAKKPVYRDA